MNSIRRFGFVVPVITRLIDGLHEIVDGEHRWKAAKQLGYTSLPVFEVGPIGDHEAQQLTVVLNELRGKPDDKRMGELLRGLLAKSTVDELVEVMPWNKDQFAKVAQLPGFDWDGAREKLKNGNGERMVERIFRLPASAAKVLDEALVQAKAGDDMSDAQALEAIATEYIA